MLSVRATKRIDLCPVGLSDLLDTKYFNDVNPELESLMDGNASPVSLSDAQTDSRSINFTSINVLGPRNTEQRLHDVL